MNFQDRTILQLADRAQRANLFDALALEQIAAAAYDVDVEAPFSAVFDEVTIGLSILPQGVIEGMWGALSAPERIQTRLVLTGLATQPPLQFDALWRGAVVARVQPATSPVTQASVDFPGFGGVDTEIVADLGALPDDPAALEQARRTRVLEQLRVGFGQPEIFSEERLDAWLASIGAKNTGELITRFSPTVYGASIRLVFAPPEPVTPTPVRLPITAAVNVREVNGLSLRSLLLESKAIRAGLLEAGVGTPAETRLRQRNSIVVTWIVPEAIFDDTDWPGGNAGTPAERRAARRTAAASWLQGEGIVIAPVA